MYGVLGGKSDWGTTESNVAVICPVALEITKVAADTRPDLTARDEVTTVIMGASTAPDWPVGDLGGVG